MALFQQTITLLITRPSPISDGSGRTPWTSSIRSLSDKARVKQPLCLHMSVLFEIVMTRLDRSTVMYWRKTLPFSNTWFIFQPGSSNIKTRIYSKAVASKQKATSMQVCPRCGRGHLVRVRRRPIDRLLSLFMHVNRYRCYNFTCQWEGNLRTRRQTARTAWL